MKPKVGLMLGGGGAKGGYQLGVIKALQEEKLLDNIDCIAGTSIGAINGLLIATLKDADKIFETWVYAQEKQKEVKGFTRFKEDKRGLYSLDVLRDVFRKTIDLKKLENSPIDLYVVTSKLINPKLIASQIRTSNYEKCVFRINDAPDAMDKVIASASIPLYFGPTQIGLEFHVDGGVVDNNPIDVLIDAGCEVILTVPLDHGFDPSIYRHKNVMIINLTDLSVFQKVSILDAYDIIRFDQTHINEKANYGYFVAKDVITKLRDLNLLKKGLILNYNENFVKPTRYIYFDVPLETYEKVQKLKEERIIKRKEQKKRQKYQKKLNKKMKEDNQ